eukprot:scaffold40262_cov30-Tisochrysis_lutea.AAC.3
MSGSTPSVLSHSELFAALHSSLAASPASASSSPLALAIAKIRSPFVPFTCFSEGCLPYSASLPECSTFSAPRPAVTSVLDAIIRVPSAAVRSITCRNFRPDSPSMPGSTNSAVVSLRMSEDDEFGARLTRS